MSGTQFVQMYHPLIPESILDPVLVSLSSADDHAARGWLLVDPGVELPEPETPYYTREAADSRFALVDGSTTPVTSAGITDATVVGRAVLTAADAAAARTAIGAGTSTLALGTTSSTAKAGDYQPAAANISDATTVGRSVLTAADAAAARAAIGADTGGSGGVTAFVDIMSSGAVGDGVTNDTTALQTFINANTGKIITWPTKTFNVSQLLLPSNTHLELGDATIRRTGNTSGAAAGATIRNTDQAAGNSNITVRGGTITSGSGTSGRAWSMVGVTELRVKDLEINKGASTFADWMFHFERCQTVFIDDIWIWGGTAVGEDGLHIKSSQDMVINNIISDVGDDALVLVHEFNQTVPIKNITITNCVLASKSANALRISVWTGETQAIEDVTISNVVIRPPASGTSGGTCITIGDQTNTGLLRRINLSNFRVNATGYAGNAVNVTNMVDSTFSNWRVVGASNRSFLISNGQRLQFTDCIADTPAVATGNPQWAVDTGSTHIRFAGCQSRDSRIWGWVIGGAGTSDITFVNCSAINTPQSAWVIAYAARVTFVGCYGNTIEADTTNPPTNIKVIGSHFTNSTALTTPVGSTTYIGNTDGTTSVATSSTTTSRLTSEMVGFYSALANRHNAPCDILVLGDSITEGEGSTPNANRWIDQFRDRIRALYPTTGVTGGYGFVAATSTITAGDGFTVTGNTAGDNVGLGARAKILGGTTGSGPGAMSITRTCTSFEIHHKPPTTGSAFTVTIDGGAPTTVTGVTGEQVWTSPALTDAAHTIVITNSSGLNYIEGAFFYRGDETKGVRIWEAGRSGSRVGNFVSGGSLGTTWADSITKVTPDLIVIAFGTNDSAQVSVAQFSTDLTALIAVIRTKASNATIALMPPLPRVSGTLAPWADYVAAASAVADATAKCVLLDISARTGTPSPDTYSLLADSLHPNNKGHALMADMNLSLLSTGN